MAADLHTEGLQHLLEVVFSGEQNVQANFYIGLATDASLAEDAALSDITEVSGTGYAREVVASDNIDFTSASVGTNDRKVTTKTVTFTAGGTWTGAKTVFLATSNDSSGKLIASIPLSQTRILNDGDTLDLAIAMYLVG